MAEDTKVLIVFYSSYGHVHKLADGVGEGVDEVEGTAVRIRRIPELEAARKAMSTQDAYRSAQEEMEDIPDVTIDDLRWADGVVWGTPTRFGNMTAQMKQFIDTLGPAWSEGVLEDKPTGIFTSSNTVHGGQETTIVSSLLPLLHLGMVFVGTPYGQNPQIMTAEAVGGSPYGASTIAGPDGSLEPAEEDIQTARNLGSRVARMAAYLKAMREGRTTVAVGGGSTERGR